MRARLLHAGLVGWSLAAAAFYAGDGRWGLVVLSLFLAAVFALILRGERDA